MSSTTAWGPRSTPSRVVGPKQGDQQGLELLGPQSTLVLMPPPRVVILAGLALALTCQSTPSPRVTDPPAAVASLARAPAPPVPSVPSADASSAPVAPTPSFGDEAGWIACGRQRCRARKELCCVPDLNRLLGKQKEPFCLDMPAVKPATADVDNVLELYDVCWRADGIEEFRLCDGPGDCGAGQTCCWDKAHIVSGNVADFQGCRPVRQGRVTCGHAEICSDKEPSCVTPGSTCEENPKLARGECVVPNRRKPNCGAGPCADGMSCVVRDGNRSCVPGRLRWPEKGVVECDRSSDCPEGHYCFASMGSLDGEHWCDRSSHMASNGSDPALCADVGDCRGYCWGSAAAFCETTTVPAHQPIAQDFKFCECRKRCTRTQDCAGECAFANVDHGLPNPPLEGFCSPQTRACECRPGKRTRP